MKRTLLFITLGALLILNTACGLFSVIFPHEESPAVDGNPSLEEELLPLITITPTQEFAAPTPPALENNGVDIEQQQPHFVLMGIVFFDLDGDGSQDESEPGIGQAPVCLESSGGSDCTVSAQDGSYKLETSHPGPHSVRINSPTNDPIDAFRYMSSPNGESEVPAYYINNQQVPEQMLPNSGILPIDKSIAVDLNLIHELDVGLIQGYLTDPFACKDRALITNFHGFDLDPEPGSVRNYLGETQRGYGSEGKGTIDNHAALDWGSLRNRVIGIPVRAAAPGTVAFAGEDITSHGACRMVTLAHPDTGHKTGYVHLDTILVSDGQRVQRGQILGTLGRTCTDWPHLHFTFNPGWKPDIHDGSNKDPFRDTQDAASITWWTRDNKPVCVDW